MPQTYQIKAPDGNWLEVDSDAPPTDAQALAVVRAYGDSVAARAQQKAQDMSTPGGILKRTAMAAGSAVMDALNPMNYWRAEQAKTQELKDQQAARQRGDVPPDWRNLDPKPAGPPQTIGEGLASLSDPDVGGRVIGQLGLGLVLPRVAAKVPPAMEGTGNLITRRAVAMNPAVTEAIGGAVGGIVDDNTWRGVTAGRAVGKAAPDVLAGAGRLLTKGGRMLGGVPATEPSTLPKPGNPIPAQDLQAMLEELRQPEPTPSVQAPPSDVQPAGAGRTETGAVSSGRPAVTPERYQEIQAQAQAAARPAPAAAEAPAPPPVAETEAPLPTQSVVPPPAAAAAPPEPPSTLREQLVASLEKNAPQPAPGVTATEGVKPPPPTGVVQEAETVVPDYTHSSGMNRLTPDHLDALGEDILSQMDTGEGRGGGQRAYKLEDAAGAFLDHLKNQQGQFKGGLRAELETFLNSADVGKAARTRLREVVQGLDTPATITPSPEGESTIPSREQMTPDELSRAREGARDSPDRQPGETVEDYRLRTAGRATGDRSAEPSIIPARRAGAIDDTIESMYERNATDQEFRDYLAKSKNHPKNGEIAAKIESKAHSYKRPSPLAHVIAGAALTGAALRQALVGQLQGDDKQEQD